MVEKELIGISVKEEEEEEKEKEVCGCPICSNADITESNYINEDFRGGNNETNLFDDLIILSCEACGFSWVSSIIEQERLIEFYDKEYRKNPLYSQVPIAYTYDYNIKNDKIPFNILNKRSLAQIMLAKLFLKKEKGVKFLDIGAGYGASFKVIRKIFKKSYCAAYEADIDTVQFLKNKLKVNVLEYSISENLFKQGDVNHEKFDLILMSHVLEHFNCDDVSVVLSNVNKLLDEEGKFVCEVPCVDFRLHKNKRINDAPHLMFFSKHSLRKIIENSGMSVDFIDTCSQDYEEWWMYANSESNSSARKYSKRNKKKIKYFTLYRKIVDVMGRFVPDRVISAAYSFINSEWCAENLSSDEFSYGGNRTCIRCVCSRSKDL